jgi:hypothetical protein
MYQTNILLKALLTLMIAALCVSCGGGSPTNKQQASPSTESKAALKAIPDVIRASVLITRAEAEAIFDRSMKDRENDGKSYFTDEITYVAEDLALSVSLWQEALHDKKNDFEKSLLKNGWTSYMKEMEKALSLNYHKQNIVQLDGIGGASYLQEGIGDQWLIYIFCGDYFMHLALNVNGRRISEFTTKMDSEEGIAWKIAKLQEAGKLAVERLKAIIKT